MILFITTFLLKIINNIINKNKKKNYILYCDFGLDVLFILVLASYGQEGAGVLFLGIIRGAEPGV